MKKLYFSIKLVFASIIIFIIQLMVWFCFELTNSNHTDFGFFLFVTVFFLTFYICFGFFQKWLAVRSFFSLLLLSSVQLGFSIFIIFSEETAKIRAIDILFYLFFIICYYILLNKFEKAKKVLVLLTASFTLICFFFYQRIGWYVMIQYFEEAEYKNTTDLHKDFYYMNEDSSKVIYPFREKNKVYFIELWNRHCGTCIKNLPEMNRLMEFYKNDANVEIISLYCPGINSESRKWFYLEYCVKSKRIPKLNYHYTSVNSIDKFTINTFPHFYLIDKNGKGIEGTFMNFDRNYPNNIYEKIEALKKD